MTLGLSAGLYAHDILNGSFTPLLKGQVDLQLCTSPLPPPIPLFLFTLTLIPRCMNATVSCCRHWPSHMRWTTKKII